ncbi:hypothetical protein EMPS_07213 [Entomortierella parvispora]|uniref:GST C-terminal domain-containing protein n=1 Tax=Entomortierella parvispora TaxID=205924 RepID=A0A9P3HE35_9FUNG|nr:hypothetical protein EMPS_07213 [Entomortierella parvispora]
MSTPCLRSFVSDLSTAEQSAVLANPDSTFRLAYFKAFSAGATARDLLAYGKATWKNQFPTDIEWSNGSGTVPTPFRVMPLLNIISPDGKEVFITETIVIDHFLAKRYNLLGDNEYEEMTIKGIYNNIHYLRERSFIAMTWTYEDKRKEALGRFMTRAFPRFIEDQEFHLNANGNNGHYIGNKLSLADIHLANVIDHFATLPSGKEILALFQKSELWKVKENVEKNPDIAVWRASEEFKQCFDGSVKIYSITAVPKDGAVEA